MTPPIIQKNCPISRDRDIIPLIGYEHVNLVKSRKSGMVFSKIIPSSTELEIHYNNYSRESKKPAITLKRYDELLDKLEGYRKLNRILDIGCGNGVFLERALLKGWEVYGTELNSISVETCVAKNINMKFGKLFTDMFPNDFFDVITSFEVIEHISNPIEEVNFIHGFLRKKGLFYLTTPNFNAVERRVLKSNYPVISYPEHLCYFTTLTLNYLLSENDFKKIFLKTTGLSVNILRSAKNESMPYHSNIDKNIREKLESGIQFRMIKKIANGILNAFKSGNKIIAGYIKY